MSDKREDYLTWDEYFMGVAMLSGMRSKDPNTQVGCCIVSQDNKICPWDTMDFRKDAQMMNFRGRGKAKIRWRQSMCIPHTVN